MSASTHFFYPGDQSARATATYAPTLVLSRPFRIVRLPVGEYGAESGATQDSPTTRIRADSTHVAGGSRAVPAVTGWPELAEASRAANPVIDVSVETFPLKDYPSKAMVTGGPPSDIVQTVAPNKAQRVKQGSITDVSAHWGQNFAWKRTRLFPVMLDGAKYWSRS